MKKIFKLASLFSLGLILLIACKKETPAPTVSFTFTVVGNVVTFTAVVTNDSKYEWDFGDGSYINTLHAPIHTYSIYGQDFTVTLTIKGPGGQTTVSNKVTIPPKTKMQLLTGGTDASSSKKWRISATAPALLFAVPDANLTVAETYPGNIFGAVGLAQVYNDEFVFKGDGSLTINPKGGGILAGYVYCAFHGIAMAADHGGSSVGLAYASPFTTPAGATFVINEGKNLTVSTTANGVTAMDVTYNNVMTLSFTNKGFLAIMDYMSECIVQQLTDTQMTVAFFVSVVPDPAAPQVGKATNVLIMTLEVAP